MKKTTIIIIILILIILYMYNNSKNTCKTCKKTVCPENKECPNCERTECPKCEECKQCENDSCPISCIEKQPFQKKIGEMIGYSLPFTIKQRGIQGDFKFLIQEEQKEKLLEEAFKETCNISYPKPVQQTCPPEKVCPPENVCPPEKVCPPENVCPPEKVCPPKEPCPVPHSKSRNFKYSPLQSFEVLFSRNDFLNTNTNVITKPIEVNNMGKSIKVVSMINSIDMKINGLLSVNTTVTSNIINVHLTFEPNKGHDYYFVKVNCFAYHAHMFPKEIQSGTGIFRNIGTFNSTSTSTSTSTTGIITNNRCGPNHGNKRCPGNECCSSQGWCAGTKGTQSAHCSQKDGAVYTGYYLGKYDGRTDQRCGPNHGGKKCPGKECCSSSGYCGGHDGNKSDWCTLQRSETTTSINGNETTSITQGYMGIDNGKYDGSKSGGLFANTLFRTGKTDGSGTRGLFANTPIKNLMIRHFKFGKSFINTPKVQCFLTGFKGNNNVNGRLLVQNVTKEGFDVELYKWTNHNLSFFTFNWIAIDEIRINPPNRYIKKVNLYSTPKYCYDKECNDINVKSKGAGKGLVTWKYWNDDYRYGKELIGLSGFDNGSFANIRIELKITNSGVASLKTWGDSIVYSSNTSCILFNDINISLSDPLFYSATGYLSGSESPIKYYKTLELAKLEVKRRLNLYQTVGGITGGPKGYDVRSGKTLGINNSQSEISYILM